MKWLQICLPIAIGIIALVPLCIAMVDFIKDAIKNKNWAALFSLAKDAMGVAEVMYDGGTTERKEFVMGILRDRAEELGVVFDEKATSDLIKDLTDLSKHVNALKEKKASVEISENEQATPVIIEQTVVETVVESNTLTKSAVQDGIVKLCKAENGYIGHKSAADLDDAKANQGGKYTKYARDLDADNYFNGKKQGYDWCAVFICWIYWKILGAKKARAILGQPKDKNYAAGAKYISEYCQRIIAKESKDCQIGDIVCYDYEGTGSYDHVGIIYAVDKNYIYVCQGNATSIGPNGCGGVGINFVHSTTHKNVKGIYRPYWDRL